MLAGYEVIGDSDLPGRAWWPFAFLNQHIAFDTIRKTKKHQVALYLEHLRPLWKSANFFLPRFSPADAAELRGFPIGLNLSVADTVLTELRAAGILIRFELNDSPWAKKWKVVYLPLGPQVGDADVVRIANTLTALHQQEQ